MGQVKPEDSFGAGGLAPDADSSSAVPFASKDSDPAEHKSSMDIDIDEKNVDDIIVNDYVDFENNDNDNDNKDPTPTVVQALPPTADCEPMNADIDTVDPLGMATEHTTGDAGAKAKANEDPATTTIEVDSSTLVLGQVPPLEPECAPVCVPAPSVDSSIDTDAAASMPIDDDDLHHHPGRDAIILDNDNGNGTADLRIQTQVQVQVAVPEPRTGREYMQVLILRNLQAVLDEDENKNEDKDGSSDSSQASEETQKQTQKQKQKQPETINVNALSTPWRFVFNTHHELEDEVMEDVVRYGEPKVKYPKGKRLGGSQGGGVMWAATLADFYRVEPWSAPEPEPEPAESESNASTQSQSQSQEQSQSSSSSSFSNQRNKKTTSTSPIRVVTSSMLHARYSPLLTGGERHKRLRQILRIAQTEETPSIVPVYSIERLVRDGEAWVAQTQEGGASWARKTLAELKIDDRLEKKSSERWELSESWPPESVFNPSVFPRPWPLEPFKTHWWQPEECVKDWVHVPTLQQYIPQHLLPEKLIVHDPWELLKGVRCTANDKSMAFVEKDDIVRIFTLSLDQKPRYDQDEDEAKDEAKNKEKIREAFLACPHSSTQMPEGMFYEPRQCAESEGNGLGPTTLPVYVVFPVKPKKVAPKEAHLYLSPAETMGQGNHSYVYRAELEIPRSMLVGDVICEECVRVDVKRILEEEDGGDGERRDAKWDDETAGNYILKVRGSKRREVMFGSEEAMCEWDDDHDHPAAGSSQLPDVDVVYEGPYRAIQTTVGYQNLERTPYCEHLRTRSESIHPLTTRVQVAAKLSMRYDSEDHLPTEASNYQAFPKHFFEHRTGYNLPELLEDEDVFKDPVPSGAVVPQFYGYYEADWKDEKNKDLKGRREHLSPILLVEDCGQSIVPGTMTVDDRNECVSLLLRMHAAGWIHNSLYRRNIVRQRGPLSEHPVIRRSHHYLDGRSGYGLHWSFRLIDFGRSASRYDRNNYNYHSELQHERQKLEKWVKNGVLN